MLWRQPVGNLLISIANINIDIKSPNVEENWLAAYIPEVDKTTLDRNKAFNILTKFEIDGKAYFFIIRDQIFKRFQTRNSMLQKFL